MKLENLVFKPRASLLLQLGDKLIKNENIAIIELIKNAYDADASVVNVTLSDINSPMGKIIIEDNGIGMTADIVKNVWLEPGNDHKKIDVQNERLSKKGRLPIGEKGIGRFGVHKLGNKISLITKAANNKEICVTVDWNNFENVKYLEDVKIDVSERDPEHFINNEGTYLEITDLKKIWNEKEFLELKRAIEHFNSPFSTQNGFNVKLSTNLDGWDKKALSFDEIKEMALYHYKSIIDAEGNESFLYEFIPFVNMEINGREKRKSYLMTDKDGNPIRNIKNGIGVIEFELYCFDRDNKIISKYLTADKKQFTQYLDANGGIYVFRDGTRIYDYGEPENDWLGLDHARFNQPSSKISNNIVIGAVNLKRAESTSLIEKSNREGFIENDAYKEFKAIIQSSIDNFLSFRNADKEYLRNGKKEKKEPVIDDIKQLKIKIDLSEINAKSKKEMLTYLDRIENDYSRVKEVSLLTSTAGMSYGIVIHEIEKIIKEISLRVISEQTSLEFRNTIYHLSDIIQNYSNLIRQKKQESCSLIELINQAKFNCGYRLKAHDIEMIINENFNKTVKCSYNLIVGAMLNIIDNSIWWLHKFQIKNKKIFITVSDFKKDYISIVVADNGKGFTIEPSDAVKPFVTQKNGGIGLGLNIVNEIMISHNGILDFPEFTEISGLPREFENGAIVALCFKEEK